MLKHCKISRYKLLKIVECFCIDIDATKTSQLLKINRNTVNRYFNVFRRLIADYQRSEKAKFIGVVEVDESYFGPSRLRGRPGPRKRGRATLKQPVFGIYVNCKFLKINSTCCIKTTIRERWNYLP